MNRRARAALALGALGMLAGGPAVAHPLAPSLVELRVDASGEGELLLRTPRLRAPGAELGVDLGDGCRLLEARPAALQDDAVVVRFGVDCGARGPVGARLEVTGLDRSRTQALVRVVFADGRVVRRLLDAERPALRIPEAASRPAIAADHLALGARHLASGLDHVLFVVGLCLLLGGWRRLVPAVTAFTLGHSLTLGLVVLGFARVAPSLAELAIAGSLLLLACELARRPGTPPGPLARHAVALPFAFGLLHGLGFAGALLEAGVPRARAATGLAVRLRPLPAYAIGSLAALWCFERGLAAF